MKIKKEDIPVAMEDGPMKLRILRGQGDYDMSYFELPKGLDFTPVLKGLPNDMCPCPHYGYIFEGAFRFIYDDGTEELFEAGDFYYAPPGHTAIVEKDLKFIDLSPSKDHSEVLEHVGKKMAEG